MRYVLPLLALACGASTAEDALNEAAPEEILTAELVVHNRSFDNVIVRVCEAGICRRVIGFVGARTERRGVFGYESDANLMVEVQYIGQDPGTWRSELLYWVAPGICVEVEVHPYETRRHNSLKRCSGDADETDP